MLRDNRQLDYRDIQALPHTFTSSVDPKVILSNLIERASRILNATRCSVVRLDPDRHPGRAFVFTAADDPSIEGYSLSLDAYPEIQAALTESRPVLVRDEPGDPIADRIRERHRKLPFPLSVLIPLTYRDENFGVLFLRFADAQHPLRIEEVELCQLVAFGAAVALHNAREYEDLLASIKDREHGVARLEEAHRLQMEMLASAAHDIRTPLHSILGYVDLLAEHAYGALAAEQVEVLGYVGDNAQTLLQIVNSLIDHARLEEGRIPTEATKGEVARLLEELRIILEPLARQRKVQFAVRSSGALPLIETDWPKLKRVLMNLLHNALKFSAGGAVSLEAGSDDGHVWFEVSDSGPGIPAEHLPHIFDRFYRVNPKRDETPGGLGLSIVKRYCEILGADISVSSAPGQGSRFRVSVPRSWRGSHEHDD
jgi:signal transduction histidine kinase